MKIIYTNREDLMLPDDYPYRLGQDVFGPNCPDELRDCRIYEVNGRSYIVQPGTVAE